MFVPGILRNGKCYTFPLIPAINQENIEKAPFIDQDDFRKEVAKASIQNIFIDQETNQYAH